MNQRLLDSLTAKAFKWYGQNDVLYHDYAHASSVLHQVLFLAEESSIPISSLDSYIMAALYHDVVYIPGAPPGVNEAASEAQLAHDFMRSCLELNLVESVEHMHYAQRMIGQTTISHHLSSTCVKGMEILLDADLYSLSLPYDQFVYNQKNIIAENLGDPEVKQMHQKSANFLYTLANGRTTIYRTKKSIELWEENAQSNIKRWFEEAYSK